jgi:hypothetical protein
MAGGDMSHPAWPLLEVTSPLPPSPRTHAIVVLEESIGPSMLSMTLRTQVPAHGGVVPARLCIQPTRPLLPVSALHCLVQGLSSEIAQVGRLGLPKPVCLTHPA